MFSPTRLRSKDFGGPADRLRPSGFVESRQSGASVEARLVGGANLSGRCPRGHVGIDEDASLTVTAACA